MTRAVVRTMLPGSTVLALADDVPNEEALALAPTIGWLMLAAAVCTIAVFLAYREGWRRLWLRVEDPRAMGAFRIAFGLCALCNVNGLWELFGYLFTDEGLFVTDVARQVYAREQFEGFGNGLGDDPYGFFDAAAFWQWLKGPKYSLLFFDSTPAFFWTHLVAFELAMACLILGFRTRYTKWVAWFLFHSIIQRNTVYWEGTENVYRTFFFYLCLSRCGHAYSIDNWLRCRRLARAGRLSTRNGPGGGAGTAELEPVYRAIAAWPRLLVILQCAALYCYTGAVKNGAVWWSGDAFYYAFNLDHFYRVPPQQLSAAVGTTLFRVNSHAAHLWETFFPLVVFGMIARWAIGGDVPKLGPWSRRVATAGWIGLGLFALAIVIVAYPVHFAAPKDSGWTLERAQAVFAAGWLATMVFVAWGWRRLRRRPFTLRGHTIDLDRVLAWTFGRRIWLTIGTIFHLHLIVMMNIGWFSPGALTGFVCFLNGGEVALLLATFGRVLARLGLPFVPAAIARGEAPLPGPDPTLPGGHRDAARLPMASLVIAAAMAVAGVFLQVHDVLHFGWTLGAIAAFLLGATLRERAANGKHTLEIVARPRRGERPLSPDQITRPWAYGPIGRFLVGALTIYHVTGVAAWLLPDKDCLAWRVHTHEPFRWWLSVTQTTQGWKMFAPNPPRSNLYLRVLVIDQSGETFDMNTDVYHPSQRPIPWIFYTRQRKINRRVAGAEGGDGSWYQKWHARWYCRQWALEHGGELPYEVQLVKITVPIPPPEEVAKKGPYDPVERMQTKSTQKKIFSVQCETEPEAQPPDVIRARHGLPPSDVEVRRWGEMRGRLRRWQAKRAREADAPR